jgi:hypothetical protein
MRVVLPYRLKRSIFYKDINLSNNTGLFAVFVLGVFASVASAMLTPYVLHATTNSGNFIFLKTVRKTAFVKREILVLLAWTEQWTTVFYKSPFYYTSLGF